MLVLMSRVEAELRKLPEAELRQFRGSPDDLVKDKLEFRPRVRTAGRSGQAPHGWGKEHANARA